MKKLVFALSLALLITSCASQTEKFVTVKYREDPVNIANSAFEYLNTSKSSFVRGAWYDEENTYMVIKLQSTYYHYCGLPPITWTQFKYADSFGTTYNQKIKDRYDCRIGHVPDY